MIQPDKQQYPKIMFGVSTEQNTTNVLPALQLGVKEFCFLESETARDSKWSEGAKRILEERGIKIIDSLVFGNDVGGDIGKLSVLLNEKVYEKPVIWNLGGGLKPHQLAVWNTLQNRNRNHIPDIACYASPETMEIQLIAISDNTVEQYSVPMLTDIRVEELLGVFGFAINGNKIEKLYPSTDHIISDEFDDLFHNQLFREYLFRLAAIPAALAERQIDVLKEMSSEELKQVFETRTAEFGDFFHGIAEQWFARLQEKNHSEDLFNKKGSRKVAFTTLAADLRKSLFDFVIGLNHTPEFDEKMLYKMSATLQDYFINRGLKLDNEFLVHTTGYTKFSNYFEQLVINRMRRMLHYDKHNYVSAYSNLEISIKDSINKSGEYDVLCMTNSGVFHAYDAKTFTFEPKDNDARLMNLIRASGRFVKFAAVIPFDPEDINEDWFPQALRDEVWQFHRRGTPFYVVADSRNADFYVTAEKVSKNKRAVIKVSDHGPGIRCRLLKNAFKK